jgi:hypothetical protein
MFYMGRIGMYRIDNIGQFCPNGLCYTQALRGEIWRHLDDSPKLRMKPSAKKKPPLVTGVLSCLLYRAEHIPHEFEGATMNHILEGRR